MGIRTRAGRNRLAWLHRCQQSDAVPQNDVALMTDTLPDDVELELTNKTVIPTRGAIVRAEYNANIGMRVLMNLTLSNGQPIPFGAIATIKEENNKAFIVGDKGQVYLTGLSPKFTLNVVWGDDAKSKCQVNYNDENQSEGG